MVHRFARRWTDPLVPHIARLAVLTAIYVIVARPSLRLDPLGGFATFVWPPTGLAVLRPSLRSGLREQFLAGPLTGSRSRRALASADSVDPPAARRRRERPSAWSYHSSAARTHAPAIPALALCPPHRPTPRRLHRPAPAGAAAGAPGERWRPGGQTCRRP